MILRTSEFRIGIPEGQPALLHSSGPQPFVNFSAREWRWQKEPLGQGSGLGAGRRGGSRRWDSEVSKSVPRTSVGFFT